MDAKHDFGFIRVLGARSSLNPVILDLDRKKDLKLHKGLGLVFWTQTEKRIFSCAKDLDLYFWIFISILCFFRFLLPQLDLNCCFGLELLFWT